MDYQTIIVEVAGHVATVTQPHRRGASRPRDIQPATVAAPLTPGGSVRSATRAR
jgi:hypothetical protein